MNELDDFLCDIQSDEFIPEDIPEELDNEGLIDFWDGMYWYDYKW